MTRRPPAPTSGKALGVSAILALFLLSGCSFFSHAVTWTKPGVGEDQAHSDLAQCKEQADVQVGRDRDIDQDIAAANGGANAGIDTSPLQNMQAYKDDRRYTSIIEDCMAQLGYRKVE